MGNNARNRFIFAFKTQFVLVTLSKALRHYKVKKKQLVAHNADHNICFLLQKTQQDARATQRNLAFSSVSNMLHLITGVKLDKYWNMIGMY